MENVLFISSDTSTYNKYFAVDLESSLENNYYGKTLSIFISVSLKHEHLYNVFII